MVKDYRVKSDVDNIYSVGKLVSSNDVITDYCTGLEFCYIDKWLRSMPTYYAMKYIGEMWGIEFEKVS